MDGFEGILPQNSAVSSWFQNDNDDDNNSSSSSDSESSQQSFIWKYLPEFPKLTLAQRMMGFFFCFVLTAICLVMGILLIPRLMFRARKFCLVFSMGSLSFLIGMSMLRGPQKFIKHTFTSKNSIVTVTHLASIVATLYAALALRSTLLTLLLACLQIACLATLLAGYIPGGVTGLKALVKGGWIVTRRVVWPTVKPCISQGCMCV